MSAWSPRSRRGASHPPTSCTGPIRRPRGGRRFLRSIGHRLVITHQDLIAFHNPAYHAGFEQWLEHRAVTRTALAAADRVAFFSRHARSEAIAEELVDPPRARVVLLGTDHRITAAQAASRAPSGADRWADRPFLLCLGTDFLHKNRVFAIRLLAAMHERHGYEGDLVLAGPHVAAGSSARDEAEELGACPGLAQRVADIGAVDEAGKRWLMERADAVVYPTTYEGFGLVPFEAGDAEVPCLFAPDDCAGRAPSAIRGPAGSVGRGRQCGSLRRAACGSRPQARARASAASGRRRSHLAPDGGRAARFYQDAMNAPSRDALGMIETLARAPTSIRIPRRSWDPTACSRPRWSSRCSPYRRAPCCGGWCSGRYAPVTWPAAHCARCEANPGPRPDDGTAWSHDPVRWFDEHFHQAADQSSIFWEGMASGSRASEWPTWAAAMGSSIWGWR